LFARIQLIGNIPPLNAFPKTNISGLTNFNLSDAINETILPNPHWISSAINNIFGYLSQDWCN
jgi:hypothetical protein